MVVIDDGTAQAWLRVDQASVFFKMMGISPVEAQKLQDAGLQQGEMSLHNADDGDEYGHRSGDQELKNFVARQQQQRNQPLMVTCRRFGGKKKRDGALLVADRRETSVTIQNQKYTTFARGTITLTAIDVAHVSYMDKARVLLRSIADLATAPDAAKS